MGMKAVSWYTRALDMVLTDKAHHKWLPNSNDKTLVWWREPSSSTDAEQVDLFSLSAEDFLESSLDSPEQVQALLSKAVRGGKVSSVKLSDQMCFGILSRNQARWVVDEFRKESLGEILHNLAQWTRVTAREDGKHTPWWDMPRFLVPHQDGMVRGDKWKGSVQKYNAALLHTMLYGESLPDEMLDRLLARFQKEGTKTVRGRLSLLRAILHYNYDVDMKLEELNQNYHFVIGRMLAMADQIQRKALPDVNRSLGEQTRGQAERDPNEWRSSIQTKVEHYLNRVRRVDGAAAARLEEEWRYLSYLAAMSLSHGFQPSKESRALLVYGYDTQMTLTREVWRQYQEEKDSLTDANSDDVKEHLKKYLASLKHTVLGYPGSSGPVVFETPGIARNQVEN